MRSWLLVMLLAAAPAVHAAEGASPGRAVDARDGTISALAGAWTGHWHAQDSPDTGAMEVIFSDGPRPGVVLAQFTFVQGANTQTSRREGVVAEGHVRFEAPDAGAIVLRMDGPGRLVGDFSGPTLPVPRGALQLTRSR